MVTAPKIVLPDSEKLHLDILPSATQNAFFACSMMPLFSEPGWYLAGGTALALQIGHRQSFDLDFFTTKKTFAEKKVEETLSTFGDWKTSSLSRGTIYGEIGGTKISLIAYPFFKARDPFLQAGTISIIKPADIAVMKIIAISQRGKKRDFFDLFWLSLLVRPLFQSIEAVQKQYTVRQNFTHILKSLVYFEDAESDPEPEIYFDADWQKVKEFFNREVSAIANKVMNLNQ